MADHGTMRDHIKDLMMQVSALQARVRKADAEIERLRIERDEARDEFQALRSELIRQAVHGE